MWIYSITGKTLTDGTRIIPCYSGAQGVYQNNPDYISHPDFGPVPIGLWDIGPAFDDPKHGRCVMRLTPQAGTDTFGRSGFMLHGDSIAHPGQGSEGCIATCGPDAYDDRTYINASPIKTLEVIA